MKCWHDNKNCKENSDGKTNFCVVTEKCACGRFNENTTAVMDEICVNKNIYKDCKTVELCAEVTENTDNCIVLNDSCWCGNGLLDKGEICAGYDGENAIIECTSGEMVTE